MVSTKLMDEARSRIGNMDDSLAKALQSCLNQIKYLPSPKGERHRLLHVNDTLLGWISLNKYELCCTNKSPNSAELAKLLETCPFTETINLALTVKNYLEHIDKVGWTDRTLLQALLLLLKQYKLIFSVSSKLSSKPVIKPQNAENTSLNMSDSLNNPL